MLSECRRQETPTCRQPSRSAAVQRRRTTSTIAASTRRRCASWAIRRRPRTSSQDVFLRLWRRPEAFDARRGQLGPYLRLMARSRALDLWREGQAAGRASDRLKLVTARGRRASRGARRTPRVERDEGRGAVRERPAPAARRPARGARARLLGRADRRPDRPALPGAAGHREEPHPARAGASCATSAARSSRLSRCRGRRAAGMARRSTVFRLRVCGLTLLKSGALLSKHTFDCRTGGARCAAGRGTQVAADSGRDGGESRDARGSDVRRAHVITRGARAVATVAHLVGVRVDRGGPIVRLRMPARPLLPARSASPPPAPAPHPRPPRRAAPARRPEPGAAAPKAAHRRPGRRLHVRAGRRTAVRGRVRPASRGCPSRSRCAAAGSWRTLDRGRTRAAGRYRLRDAPARRSAPACACGSAGPGVRGGAAGRPPQRLPLRARLVVRPRPLRQPPRLRRHAHRRPARRRPQVAALRHAGHPAPRRPQRARAASSTAAPTSPAASTISPRPPRSASASAATARSWSRARAHNGQRELPARSARARRRGSSNEAIAHAEQPDGPRRRVGAQQLQRDLRHRRPSSTARGSVRARVTVVQSSRRTLMAIVRPRTRLAAQALGELAREAGEHGLQLGEIGDVAVERRLAGARLGGPGLRLHDARAVEVGEAMQLAAVVAPKRCASSSSGGALQRAEGGEAERGEPLGRLRARCRG